MPVRAGDLGRSLHVLPALNVIRAFIIEADVKIFRAPGRKGRGPPLLHFMIAIWANGLVFLHFFVFSRYVPRATEPRVRRYPRAIFPYPAQASAHGFLLLGLQFDGIMLWAELPVFKIDLGKLLHRILHNLFVIFDVCIENDANFFVVQIWQIIRHCEILFSHVLGQRVHHILSKQAFEEPVHIAQEFFEIVGLMLLPFFSTSALRKFMIYGFRIGAEGAGL